MPKRTTIAPAITRVHKLFRIRTVVNDSEKLISKKEIGVDTRQIGRILVDRKLSRISILSSPNKLKRARDHALNASILGFLIPIHRGNKFIYAKSPIGDQLHPYDFDQSCPYDLHETAIFIDRMMKLKLGNAYDSRHTYSSFHTRPFLSLLTALVDQKLHLAQIHYLLSQKSDLAGDLQLAHKMVRLFAEYPSYDEKSVAKFVKDFDLGDELTLKEMSRSTKPLLDWAQQGGLLLLDKNNWCRITENGREAQNYYSKYRPIWYDLLPFDASLSAAILILYIYGLIENLRIDKKKLESSAIDALQNMQKRFSIWNVSYSSLSRPIDFDLNYDIPYNLRKDVRIHLNRLTKSLGMKSIDLDKISIYTVSELEKILAGTSYEREHAKLRVALGIDLPRRECFQTDLEWQVCVRLRVLQFPANPYQGEFEGETNLPMAVENPDIVIKNTIRVLVECKSRNEWGNVVKYDKRVGGELHMYQDYVEEVNANSAIFICDVDGFDQTTFVNPFAKQEKKLNKISLIRWDHLARVQKDKKLLENLRLVMTTPERFKPENRVLG